MHEPHVYTLDRTHVRMLLAGLLHIHLNRLVAVESKVASTTEAVSDAAAAAESDATAAVDAGEFQKSCYSLC